MKPQDEDKFKEVISSKTNLLQIQCFYESQTEIPVAGALVLEHVKNKILFHKTYLTSSDFTALGCILASDSNVIELTLKDCNTHPEAGEALKAVTAGKSLPITSLSYSSDGFTSTIDDECLKTLVANSKSLKSLSLTNSLSTKKDADLDASYLNYVRFHIDQV